MSKKTNSWIEHIKKFSKENNISYACAITDKRIKDGYIPKKPKVESMQISTPSMDVVKKNISIVPRPAKPALTDAQQKRLKSLQKQLEQMNALKNKGIMMDEDQREDIEDEIKELLTGKKKIKKIIKKVEPEPEPESEPEPEPKKKEKEPFPKKLNKNTLINLIQEALRQRPNPIRLTNAKIMTVPKLNEIVKKYNIDLEDSWNKRK